MDARELEQRIAAFGGWQYEFRFDGDVRTPVNDRALVNRQRERRRYFFEALLRATDGTLAGKRVLDLGCSAGYWSLAAIEAGAEFVLGVDAQRSYVEQAQLVFEAKAVDPARYRFERANVFELDLDEHFDVVLCLGLLDRVSRPFELFERMSRTAAELIVIDCEVSRARLSVFELTRLYSAADVVEYPLVLVPSRTAVEELADQFGYRALALAHEIADWSGMNDYRRRRRLAFICSKDAPLTGLAAADQPSLVPWWMRDPRALLSALR